MAERRAARARPDRRARVASMRAAQRRTARHRRLLIGGGGIVVVVAVIAALVTVKITQDTATNTLTTGATPASPQIVAQVTGVPAAVLEQIGAEGAGSTFSLPEPLSGAPALTANGKPEVFYDGAEFCPFCAAQRWSMIVALSRFGSFSGLQATTSSGSDVYPNTPTFSFVGSSYTSPYVTFTPVEDRDRAGKPLQKLTKAQQQLLSTYDAPPYVQQGGIPFIDYGGRYLQVSSAYSPKVLHGKSMRQIAAALDDPSDDVARAVDGAANAMTAAICSLTGNQPAQVCSAPAISTLQGRLRGGP